MNFLIALFSETNPKVISDFRQKARSFKRDIVYFCYMLQNSNIDQRIPKFISVLDTCLYDILSTDDLLQKGEIINNFLNSNMDSLIDLRNNFFVNFAFSFIQQIRQKIDKLIKKLESISEHNLHANPELIAAQQLLIDFFTPEISTNKSRDNDNSKRKIRIPEPVDFVSIYKDAFTKLKIEKLVQKSDYKFMNDYFLTYKSIFSIVQQIPQLKAFQRDFQPILSAEKLPVKYSFRIELDSTDEKEPKIEEKDLFFTLHSTVYDAKVKLSSELGVPHSSITIKYDAKHKASEEAEVKSNDNTNDITNNANSGNMNFFYNSHKNNHQNNVYYRIDNGSNDVCNDAQDSNNENSNILINEMSLVHYKSFVPFIVEFVPPPPMKYRFMTPKRNVSKPYDYTKTVADVKNDLKGFLQHEVQLRFKGKILEDHQKLSLLNIGNDIIDVTFTPDYKFKLQTGELFVLSFQLNTTMLNVYFTLRQKIDYDFLLFFRKKSPLPNQPVASPQSSLNCLQVEPLISSSPSLSKSSSQSTPLTSNSNFSSPTESTNEINSPPLSLKSNSKSENKFELSSDSKDGTSSDSKMGIDLSVNSKSENLFNLKNSPKSESNYELATEYSEPIGSRNEIRVARITKILRFFKFPSNSIRQIVFNENDTVETAKEIIRKIIIDRNVNIENLDYINSMNDNSSFRIIQGNYNAIDLSKINNIESDAFILTVDNKPLSRLTMPLSNLPYSSVISIQTTDSLLFQLLVANGERYEIQLPKTATAKDAKIEASNLFKCEFVFMKKEKIMKDSKLLILISIPQIKVEMPNQIYQFQFPNGKMKKHEFQPTMSIREIKKFVANHQKCEVENIQLSVNGKELKDHNYLYDIDVNSFICVNIFITMPFFISSKNKQSKKSLAFDINSSFRNVRSYLSEKTKHALDKLSFFDENELFIDDNKKLINMINQKIITVIIHQKNPEFSQDDLNKIDELLTSINNESDVNAQKNDLIALYVKCGLNMDRLQKNLSFFRENNLMDKLNSIF